MLSTTPLNVDELLANNAKSIQVDKEVPLTLDPGSLTAYDIAAIDTGRVKEERYLIDLARDNLQLLFNEIFTLPTNKVENVTMVQLPKPTTKLPREKPIPKPKQDTKWEAFAKTKGITNKKRGRMVFDDTAKEWRPRHGYKKVGTDKEQNWVVEVPGNGDPYKDWLGDKEDKKKEGIAKNEFQRLKNIAKQSEGLKTKGEEMKKNVNQAHVSTASLGKFTEKVKHEKNIKEKGKRKVFDPVVGNVQAEKEKSLAMISKIENGGVTINLNKAANKEMGNTMKRAREEEIEAKIPKRRSKAGTKLQAKHFDKKKGKVHRPEKEKGGKNKNRQKDYTG